MKKYAIVAAVVVGLTGCVRNAEGMQRHAAPMKKGRFTVTSSFSDGSIQTGRFRITVADDGFEKISTSKTFSSSQWPMRSEVDIFLDKISILLWNAHISLESARIPLDTAYARIEAAHELCERNHLMAAITARDHSVAEAAYVLITKEYRRLRALHTDMIQKLAVPPSLVVRNTDPQFVITETTSFPSSKREKEKIRNHLQVASTDLERACIPLDTARNKIKEVRNMYASNELRTSSKTRDYYVAKANYIQIRMELEQLLIRNAVMREILFRAGFCRV